MRVIGLFIASFIFVVIAWFCLGYTQGAFMQVFDKSFAAVNQQIAAFSQLGEACNAILFAPAKKDLGIKQKPGAEHDQVTSPTLP